MGDKAPARLMRLRDKLHYLAQAGVDVVIVATTGYEDPSHHQVPIKVDFVYE
jgi:FAD synthase